MRILYSHVPYYCSRYTRSVMASISKRFAHLGLAVSIVEELQAERGGSYADYRVLRLL
jgi:hypothetical protein